MPVFLSNGILPGEMYTQFARWYDFHYRSLKDYPAEAERIAYLLEKLDSKPQDILDVACGTGEHARLLRESYGYSVDGIDLEPNFVEIAQEKNPTGEFTTADMRTFSLPKRYDVLTCLFSSIGYAETVKGLESAISSMARHLNPGGWLIIEPWVEPDEWKPELIDANESYDEENGVRILQARKASTDGSVSVLTIDYHIQTPDEQQDFSETHRLGLFSRQQIESSLKKSSFQTRYLPKGVLSNPLYVACFTP